MRPPREDGRLQWGKGPTGSHCRETTDRRDTPWRTPRRRSPPLPHPQVNRSVVVQVLPDVRLQIPPKVPDLSKITGSSPHSHRFGTGQATGAGTNDRNAFHVLFDGLRSRPCPFRGTARSYGIERKRSATVRIPDRKRPARHTPDRGASQPTSTRLRSRPS